MMAIGVTGHRNLRDPEKVSQAVDRALAHILAVYGQAGLQLISPLAEGADRLVVWRALEKYTPHLVIPLPLERDEYLRDFKSIASKAVFTTLLEQGGEVIQLPPQPTREESYLAAGRYVLAHSEVLVALWDGEPARGTGGTAQIVAEARARCLPLAWIKVTRRGDDSAWPHAGAAGEIPIFYERFPTEINGKPSGI